MIKLILVGIISIICFSFFLPGYYFPSDVLQNVPSFSQPQWIRPQNSLLADPVYQFEPWRDFAKKELQQGRFPLWNDLNGNGVPLFANFQSAVLFPLNYIYYLFPERVALWIIPLLKLFFFSTFLYLYVKTITKNTLVSVLGGIIGATTGFPFLWLLWPHTNVYLFLPLLLYLTEVIVQGADKKKKLYLSMSLTYFLAILGGHPETLFHVGILHWSYIIFRSWQKRYLLLPIFISIGIGFLLGSVQLLPFFEYLFNSYILQFRMTSDAAFYLPVISAVLMIIPFLFGAPHEEYYRPITQNTNFQEVLGGYSGSIILITSVIGMLLYKKTSLEKYWVGIILISTVLSYKIWPFWHINTLPGIESSANHRLISFVGFGLLILFCLILNRVMHKTTKFSFLTNIPNYIVPLITIIVLIILHVIPLASFAPNVPVSFISFLKGHIFILLGSSAAFIWIVQLYFKKVLPALPALILVFFTVLFQTFFLLGDYNPIIPSKQYYQDTQLTNALENLPVGNLLEVGNPSLPAHVNMKYGIAHGSNNDAIDILWYKKAFNSAFLNRNHWGNPDVANSTALQKFNISYVLSDYDMRFKKIPLQNSAINIYPVVKSQPLILKFTTSTNNIRQIRLRTATYNRNNSCTVTFTIRKKDIHVWKEMVSCINLRNNVFYTLSIPNGVLQQEKQYEFLISSNVDTKSDTFGIYTSVDNKPFFEILVDDRTKPTFQLLSKINNEYLWHIRQSSLINGIDTYKILYKNPQKIIIDLSSPMQKEIEIKQTYYPGWVATVNGASVMLKNNNPFISLPVQKGSNYIELVYKPVSFYAGIGITLLTILSLALYQIRNVRSKKFLKVFVSYQIILVNKIDQIPLWKHIIFVLLGIFISVSIITLLITLTPISFSLPWTTAINWYTVNNYPKQQEIFYYYGGFFFVLVITFICWLISLWKIK